MNRPDASEIGEGDLTEEQLIYKENILDHYKHPHNKRTIDAPSAQHHDSNPLCGDTITMQLKMEGGRIIDASFEGKGCAISQASASMLTERLRGMGIDEAKALGQGHITAMLGIPVGIVRMKCAMLALRTTQKAIDGMAGGKEGS